MQVQLISSLFALVAAVVVGCGLYKQYDISLSHFLIFVLVSVVVSFGCEMYLNEFLSIVVFAVSMILFMNFILKRGILQSLTICLMTTFLYSLIKLAYFAFMSIDGNAVFLMKGNTILLFGMIFINVVSALVVFLYCRYRNINNISEKTILFTKSMDFIQLKPRTFAILYVAVSVMDTVCIFIFTNMAIDAENVAFCLGAMFVVFMYSLLMILTLTMIQGLLNSELRLTTKEDEVEQLKNYTETIEALVDEMQKSRHDYKNMIISIQDFVAEKKFDELEEYFRTEIIRRENQEKLAKNIYLSTKQIKLLPLKSIVNAKLNEALSLGINVEITIFSEIDPRSISAMDLCRIIGNMLDNSVEASIQSREKIISLVMLKTGNQISITLCNSFSGDVDMSAIWKKGYTTKGKGHGLGLSIVKKLVEKEHNNILLNTEIRDNMFVQDITIIEQRENEDN